MNVEVILLMERGLENEKIMELTGVSKQMVYYWRRKYKPAKANAEKMLKGI